jgi:uncharacterized RDD family membrane protein YckC
MPDKIYTLVVKGKPEGPFSLHELKAKGLAPESFIRKPGMDDYKEAHELPELRELFGFSRKYTAPQYFAGFDLRLLASCIDWFLIITATAAVELMVVTLIDQQTETIRILMSNIVILPLLKFIYHLILESNSQATLGKRMLNIKVTDLNGLKPAFSQIFIRNLSKTISTLLLFTGYLYSFLNKKHQCLHDKIANTLVIKERLI